MKKLKHDQTLGLLVYWSTVYEWSCIKFWMFVKNCMKTRQECCDFSFFKTKLFLWCVFMLNPGIADSNEFISTVVIHMPSWKNKFLPHVAFIYDLALYSCHSCFLLYIKSLQSFQKQKKLQHSKQQQQIKLTGNTNSYEIFCATIRN